MDMEMPNEVVWPELIVKEGDKVESFRKIGKRNATEVMEIQSG